MSARVHSRIIVLTILSFLASVGEADVVQAQKPTAAISFSHDNVPLGLTVNDFKKKFSQCTVADDPDNDGQFFFPLTGYIPSAPGLLPIDDCII
jgi:hypothetical protein